MTIRAFARERIGNGGCEHETGRYPDQLSLTGLRLGSGIILVLVALGGTCRSHRCHWCYLLPSFIPRVCGSVAEPSSSLLLLAVLVAVPLPLVLLLPSFIPRVCGSVAEPSSSFLLVPVLPLAVPVLLPLVPVVPPLVPVVLVPLVPVPVPVLLPLLPLPLYRCCRYRAPLPLLPLD